MTIDWDLIRQIGVPLVAAVVGAFAKDLLDRRGKLIAYYGHVASFLVAGTESEPTRVHTHSVVVRNAGRLRVQNVRLRHAVLPANIDVFPTINYAIENLPDGSREIVIPQMIPSEEITFSYLYLPPLTYADINTRVSSDEGMARVIRVIHTRLYPKWVYGSLMIFVLMGVCFAIYLFAALVNKM